LSRMSCRQSSRTQVWCYDAAVVSSVAARPMGRRQDAPVWFSRFYFIQKKGVMP
jgi:hypothetical protein